MASTLAQKHLRSIILNVSNVSKMHVWQGHQTFQHNLEVIYAVCIDLDHGHPPWVCPPLVFGGCWKPKIVQKLKDLHTRRALSQNQQMWWDLWSVKWNKLCSESDFSWHQLVWKCLIWTGCCYQLCCSDVWAHWDACHTVFCSNIWPVLPINLDFVSNILSLVFVS